MERNPSLEIEYKKVKPSSQQSQQQKQKSKNSSSNYSDKRHDGGSSSSKKIGRPKKPSESSIYCHKGN
jgi:hypothetical protein